MDTQWKVNNVQFSPWMYGATWGHAREETLMGLPRNGLILWVSVNKNLSRLWEWIATCLRCLTGPLETVTSLVPLRVNTNSFSSGDERVVAVTKLSGAGRCEDTAISVAFCAKTAEIAEFHVNPDRFSLHYSYVWKFSLSGTRTFEGYFSHSVMKMKKKVKCIWICLIKYDDNAVNT